MLDSWQREDLFAPKISPFNDPASLNWTPLEKCKESYSLCAEPLRR